MKHFNFLAVIAIFSLLLISCQQSASSDTAENQLQIIPYPNQVLVKNGSLDISGGFKLTSTSLKDDVLNGLSNYLSHSHLNMDDTGVSVIIDIENDDANAESYNLVINKKGVNITSPSEVGIFYGLQTLLQLTENDSDNLPFVEIKDAPRFGYRGLMLDCSRHFLTLDFLKKQIDMMAYLKLNRFHWHLTDGPGWRLQINKYPELTRIGAWRMESTWKEWWNSGRKYVEEGTPGAYGGYYTQDEARELVAYAAERHITVIPEIEMPGHSEEVLAIYPQLSCTGKPYTSSELCIGNDETFEFLENVLTEVMDIFPSEIIHVGGDEASREHWEKCPKCQKRIKEEGLKDEAELQSYLIKRIENFLNDNGRKLLGWDEILDGGLAPNATVMSWRGEEGGVAAARSGHDAIMTPGSHCYFDSYQGLPDTQPEAIGGFLTLEKVYSFEPIPSELTADEAKHILGAQANLWAEYIINEKHMEYMIYPRLLALAEVVWTQSENKSWADFQVRANRAIPMLQQKGYNTYTLSKEPFVELVSNSDNKSIDITLTSELYPAEIRYTIDGSNPTSESELYKNVVAVTDSANLRAQIFQDGTPVGNIIEKRVDYHNAIGKDIIYNTPYSQYYTAGGDHALIDGIPGGPAHGDGHWQGFLIPEIDIVIDLGEKKPIKSVQTSFLQNAGAEIWLPADVSLYTSDDNEEFTILDEFIDNTDTKAEGTFPKSFEWNGDVEARYIKLKAHRKSVKGWMFADEIIVW